MGLGGGACKKKWLSKGGGHPKKIKEKREIT